MTTDMDLPHQRLEDFIVSEGDLPVPWNEFERSLGPTEGFTAGSRRIADLVAKHEKTFSSNELFLMLFAPEIPSKWFERILFCLLDVAAPHIQVARQALRMKCLRRLLMREDAGFDLSRHEADILSELRKHTKIKTVTDLLTWSFAARKLVEDRLAADQEIGDRDRDLLVYLIRLESATLKERIAAISRNLDATDLAAMSRLLAKVNTFEENVGTSEELALMIDKRKHLGKRVLTFETTLGTGQFEVLVQRMREEKTLRPLHWAFAAQRAKLAGTRSLVALSSLHRWILETAAGGPVPAWEWVVRAIRAYEGESFSVEAGATLERIEHMVRNAGARVSGTSVTGNFSEKLYSQWVGADYLTRTFERRDSRYGERLTEGVSCISLVARNVHNEGAILRMLRNPKIYDTAGVVELISTRSRSVEILSTIATSPHLHTGQINGGVPTALLKNPSPVPIPLLRPFLKASFHRPFELRNILVSPGIRPEVAEEIKAFLAH